MSRKGDIPPVVGEQNRAPRRRVLQGALALGVAAPFTVRAATAATEARSERPKPGDVLVFAMGDRKGEIIAPDDLPLGGPQELAWPMEQATGTVRDGSRLNQVAVLRLDPGSLNERTAANAVEGVVAYSAMCTHQGCPISMWEDEKKNLFCSCHASQFDPRDAATVIDGPAPRRLAMLPLKLEDGQLMAAGEFTGSVGFKR